MIKTFKECEGICEETIVPDDRFKFKSTASQIEQRKITTKFLLQNGLAKSHGPAVAMRRVLEAEVDEYDWCQVECGTNHCLLLNTLGQVFTFGDGLKGQTGQSTQMLHLDTPTEVEMPSVSKKE